MNRHIFLMLLCTWSFREYQALPFPDSSQPTSETDSKTDSPSLKFLGRNQEKKSEVKPLDDLVEPRSLDDDSNKNSAKLRTKSSSPNESLPPGTPLPNSSEKASEFLEARSFMTENGVHVPGIGSNRYDILEDKKPFPDGKDCGTGQDPLTEDEAKIVRQYYDKLYEDVNPRKAKVSVWIPDPKLIESGSANCQSGKCNLDLKIMSYVCGALPKRNFTDGLSCLDGSKPVEPSKNLLAERGNSSITTETESDINRDVRKAYGVNCLSGRCFYDFSRDAYLCAGSSITPSILPLLTLLLWTRLLFNWTQSFKIPEHSFVDSILDCPM